MKVKIFLAAIALAGLPSCTPWQKVALTNYVGGWAEQIRRSAEEAYPYAQMSTNAYGDSDSFNLGPRFKLAGSADNDEIGFAYAIFERYEGDRLAEVVIAFRGTELTTWPDWMHGNFKPHQNKRGLELYDKVRARVSPAVPISVTGHSLGGGIATHVSLNRAGPKSYIFNASPRFRAEGKIADNRRLSIVEYGEVLKVARLPGREPTQTYVSINCTPGVDTLGQHRIRPLAECLTRIAAIELPEARESVKLNRLN